MAEAVLALDQGTTGTTAMVLDGRGRILGRAYGEIRQFYPRPGWVEHDPEQIYRSVVRLGREAIAASRVRPAGIGALGITNQRETFVVWERQSGRPVHRAIVWQCRRSTAICAALARREAEQVADALHRGVAIGLGIFRQQLVGDELAVRPPPDHVGEGAAAIDQELPASHHSMHGL